MGRGRKGSGVQPLKTCIRVRFHHNGKRCIETLDLKPTPANLKFAEQLIERVRREIAVGAFDYEATFPKPEAGAEPPQPDERSLQTAVELSERGFTTFSEAWLRTLALEKATMVSYRSALHAIWQPAFGERDIGSIKPSEIKQVIAERANTLTGKTINNNLIPLRQLYLFALDDELLHKSPLANIRNRKHQSPLPDPFDADEMIEILAYMEQNFHEQVWNWYDFAFATGLRPSEQAVIYWSDIDWRRETLRVQRALVKAEIKDTKTSSIRDVDLNDRALAVLKRQKVFSLMRGPNTPIFLNPLTNRSWPDEKQQRERYFLPALSALGIRRRSAYQTRHTFATIALMGGVNPAYIARQLGHTTTAMLFKHYAKWIDGADKGREAAKLGALFREGHGKALTLVGYTTFPFAAFADQIAPVWKAAARRPVFITDKGRPARVLLHIDEYERLLGRARPMGDVG